MNTSYYQFFDDLLIELNGAGGRTDTQYQEMFNHYRIRSPDREPDMVISETSEDVNPEVVLGDPDDYYGWTGDKFVIDNGNKYMAVTPGWNHIEVTPAFEPFYSIYPVEFEIRKRMVERDRALIHASGVELDGQTTLFPAWRGAGKTNTLLSLLREGADFLSDDRLWVGANGEAIGYPLGVNLKSYNIDSFSEIEISYENRKKQLQHEVYNFIDKRVDRSGPLPETAIGYLNDTYLADTSRDFIDVESLYPNANHVEQSTVDNVMFLEAAPNARNISVEEISTKEAINGVTSISNFEWDGRLREYFHAYDALVGDGDMVESLNEVIRQERKVFEDLFKDVGTYRAQIPRVGNWNKHGLDAAIVNTVTSLEPQQATEQAN